jgi:ubiquinone/menaquinone biosynthesis C-methylase UbiE
MNPSPGSNTSRLEFSRVDESSEPESFVDYLDSVTAAMQAYKQLAFRLQEVAEGDVLLDLGCGTGEDARALARHVGTTGRVVGIDNSRAMIAEARRRAAGLKLPVEYHLGHAHCLPLADGQFDGARADRVFQHLANPRAALAELVRVTRPAGRVVIGDPDWETLLVDCTDPSIRRRIKRFLCDSLAGSSTAHQLPGIMRQLGLRDVTVTPVTLVLDQLDTADLVLAISHVTDRARDVGAVSDNERASWLADLQQRDHAGCFFASLTGFLISARTPDNPDMTPASPPASDSARSIAHRNE